MGDNRGKMERVGERLEKGWKKVGESLWRFVKVCRGLWRSVEVYRDLWKVCRSI